MKDTRFILKIIISVLLISISLTGCGECPKKYNISGMVTDGNSNPLPGVDVGFLNSKWATTASDGTYSFTMPDSVSVQGEQVLFVKAGYSTVEAQQFTISEAGIDICGTVNLRRDAVLQ